MFQFREYNHNHDKQGHFASGPGGGLAGDQIADPAGEKSIVLSFGRFNPPHRGHKLLTDKMVGLAKDLGAEHALFVKGRQGPKDPLNLQDKSDALRLLTPGLVVKHAENMPDPVDVLKHYSDQGVQNLHLVFGGDRIEKLENDIAKAQESGVLHFKSITIHSAGDRSGAEMWSGTQQRDLASKGDFEGFRGGLPPHFTNAQSRDLFNKVRHGLGLKVAPVDMSGPVRRLMAAARSQGIPLADRAELVSHALQHAREAREVALFGGIGRTLREYNHAHKPSGPGGGQFTTSQGPMHDVMADSGFTPNTRATEMGVNDALARARYAALRGDTDEADISTIEAKIIKEAWVPEEVKYSRQIAEAEHSLTKALADRGEKDTKAEFTDPVTGDYTEARKLEHKRIIDFVLSHQFTGQGWAERETPLTREAHPVAIMMAGMSGAGKSTLAKGLNFKNKVYINADDIKAMLPEWKGSMAGVLHEESSDIANAIVEIGRKAGYNMVLDSTLKSLGGSGYKIAAQDGGAASLNEKLKSTGYTTEVRFTDVTVKTSLSRVINRFIDEYTKTGDGRYVPVGYVKASSDKVYGTKPRRTFENLRHHVASYVMIDNNQGGGKRVMKSKGRLTEVFREAGSGDDTAPAFPLSPAGQKWWNGDNPTTAKERGVIRRFVKWFFANSPEHKPSGRTKD